MIADTIIQKYNIQVPRYTSYPTALKFQEMDDYTHQVNELMEHNRQPRDISLYLHLPFCESLCWYCGCTRIISRKQESSAQYLRYLDTELDLLLPHLHPENRVIQVHLGGGTPTFLTPDELRWLGNRLHQRFNIADDAEMSVEIDPRAATEVHIKALAETGFNRGSLGVQDVNEKVQHAINRVQPVEMVEEVMSWLRQENFYSINFDLVYGLPHQTRDSIRESMAEITRMEPDRLAVYSYAHVPWMKPNQKLIDSETLPEATEKFRLMETVTQELTGNGYYAIGMDHFAKPDDELSIAKKQNELHRNFQGYSTRPNVDLYALGMSGISQVGDQYLQNRKELPDYYNTLDTNRLPYFKSYSLTGEDRLRRSVIMSLMCDMQLDFDQQSEKLGIVFRDHFYEEIEQLHPFVEDGLIEWTDNGFKLTPTGRFFVRNVAMTFDAYIDTGADQKRYSKSV